jgi:hypothetical protein
VFQVDRELLEESGSVVASDRRVHWLVGGAGSGKSTVCRALHSTLGFTVLDMDARIYGTYHASFSPSRHPVSCRWRSAGDGLAWLLEMTWAEFDAFNRASLPEYLDLLGRELQSLDDPRPILVDGGICNPALLAAVLEPSRIVCVLREGLDASGLWTRPGARSEMRDAVMRLDATGEKWRRFLEFDDCITSTVASECAQAGIRVCAWNEADRAPELADRVARTLGLAAGPPYLTSGSS